MADEIEIDADKLHPDANGIWPNHYVRSNCPCPSCQLALVIIPRWKWWGVTVSSADREADGAS